MASSTQYKSVGAKGSDVFSSTGNPLLDLSVLLVRGAEVDKISTLLGASLEVGQLVDAFVLAFQTRDIRGGKGERLLFHHMLSTLYSHKPALVIGLLDLIPEYGSWRDLTEMGNKAEYRAHISKLMLNQLAKDEAAMEGKKPVSLLAKWMPREGKTLGAPLLLQLRKDMGEEHSHVGTLLKRYRQRVVALNKYLQTTEIAMCDQNGMWATIDPAKVPGRNLAMHMRAFLNEKAGTKKGEHVPSGELRHPDDPDRMACRLRFQEHMSRAVRGEAKVNGAVTRYPHEVIKNVVRGAEGAEKDSLIAVWNGMVANAKALGGLERTIAMCDFSGSMQSSNNGDTPYWVSMAMGLLIAEVCSDEFKDTFLTFDSTPKWHKLPSADIFSRVASIGDRIAQGTSTDFQKAMDLVLATLKEKRVRPGAEPKDLIVITDMAWDQACSSSQYSMYSDNSYRHVVKTAPWQTHIEMIREAFKRAGEDMWGAGSGWTPPRIVIWNVAASCNDFHASADTEGVIMLSGWSPSLFKVLTEEGARVQTPEEALRVQLDAERYDPIRARLAELLKK
jgi:hypothetical protein